MRHRTGKEIAMNITKQYAIKNDCYKDGKKISVKKLMVHSTACPGVMAKRFADSWNTVKPSGRSVCVHAFLDDVSCYQLLPWDYRGWHCGGSGNNLSIGIELCEPKDYLDKAYFEKCIKNAIQVYAYLCKEYGIGVNDIISHKEGHALGIASNHGDPDHWWDKVGYTMNDFRRDVQKCINNGEVNLIISGGSNNTGSKSNCLGSGDRGNDVKELQKMLISCGYSCGSCGADGIFGSGTKNAVIKFQKDYRLATDGLAGVKTMAKLREVYDGKGNKPSGGTSFGNWVSRLQTACNAQKFSNQKVDGIAGPKTLAGCPTCRQGAKGEITRLLQEKLNSLGYNCGKVDGVFGGKTKSAVINFQKAYKLEADGIVGSKTWKKLLGL